VIKIKVDGKEIDAKEGERLLWVCLDNGIYIPNLCAVRGVEPPFGGCSLCFVEVDGRLRRACVEIVREGMEVKTNTERVRRLRETIFSLILLDHPIECKTCPKSGSCALQDIALKQKFKLKKPEGLKELGGRDIKVDDSMEEIIWDRRKCILCGRCVWACKTFGKGILDFTRRGYDTVISTFMDKTLKDAGCNLCGACVLACPVGAFVWKRKEWLDSLKALREELSRYINLTHASI